ncbi:protoheme IX farnesyltransferase [Rhizobium sp. KVB221]|uniref:Protoheme IX farnesyltransferase n=1 Tax=Rhizobium setariae TaxID=2801340 RepID=A0A936YII1_9HYPH|nr:heme o synthase [Rhizobium setariae]MBL0370825.1 protoheme IX farnesyltransferase [Rhizobium setariae]
MAVIEGENPVAGTEHLRISEATFKDYFALLKPRVMSLVIFTAVAGMVVAPGHINPVIGFIAILAIAVGAGASGALNMWYDADIDAIMSRTANRPIPAGRIQPGEALAFGITLSGFSVVVLGLAVNVLAASLLAFTIFFYAVIYTMWLKRWTPQNIVIGGAAGAFPPMIGWAAVTGDVTVESVILFMIIFLWTPAHFWALALFKMRDYGAVGVPMLPNVAGEKVTKDQILVYAVLTAFCGAAPALMGFASPVYGIVSGLLGVGFVWYSVLCRRMPDGDAAMKPAKKLFAYSIVYLFAIFSSLMIDHFASGLWSGLVGGA